MTMLSKLTIAAAALTTLTLVSGTDHAYAGKGGLGGITIKPPVNRIAPSGPVVRDHRGPNGAPQGGVSVGSFPAYCRNHNVAHPGGCPNPGSYSNLKVKVRDHRAGHWQR